MENKFRTQRENGKLRLSFNPSLGAWRFTGGQINFLLKEPGFNGRVENTWLGYQVQNGLRAAR